MNRRSEDGLALIGVIVVLSFLMALGAALTLTVMNDAKLRGAFAQSVTGFYAAESGLNKGMGEYKNIFLDWRVPNGSDFDQRTYNLGTRQVSYQLTPVPGNPKSLTIPAGQTFGGLNAQQYFYTVTSYAGVGSDTEATVGAEFNVGYIPLFQFVAFYNKDLEILPGANMALQGRVHTNGNLYLNSEDNVSLSIQDNPPAITNVQVTAQGDIYRGRKNVSDQCRGTVNVDMLQDKVAPFGDWDPKGMPCNGGSTRKVPVSELAGWKGSIVSQIQNISVPQPDIILRGTGDFWVKADLRIALRLDAANESLPVGPNGPGASPALYPIEVEDVNGNRDVAKTTALRNFMVDDNYNTNLSSYPGTRPIFYTDLPSIGACGCTDANPGCGQNGIRTCYNPAIITTDVRVYSSNINITNDRDYRRGGFYNQREKKWMILLNINLYDLIDWNARNGEPFFATDDATEGGLVIFATVVGPSSAGINNYGVRVFGSRNIPPVGKKPYPSATGIGVSADPTGVTLASDQAMYVLGDFNRANTAAGDNNEQPAALIGDSVNILSDNYWPRPVARGGPGCSDAPFCGRNDAQSPLPLANANRAGAATTVNTAFIGGVDDTTVGNYNGGLENYPRFHESWGSMLTYHGSYVSLGNPVHVNGAWCGTGNACNIYNPPTRNYNYESAFNNAANLPPLTPRFVYVQQVLFTEDFK